ncbi:MAG TPA: hypothetical protein VLJ80_08515 [Solirubrobacteraceae bacterium]|nr:hypothetical protein [Solirubrobacteraceae bacterium]
MSQTMIHDQLQVAVREYVLGILPPDGSGELLAMPLRDLLTTFFNSQGRLIPPRARSCHVSAEMRKSPKFIEHKEAVDTVISMIETGADLASHLSKKATIAHVPGADSKQPGSRDDRDLLLGEWGVHHLHLASEHASDLIFAMVTKKDAYLIGVYDHTSWGLTEVLRIVVRNWPNAGLMLETNAIGLVPERTDEERLQLRKAGFNTSGVVVDGKVWTPSALGITGDGSSSRAGRRAMDFVWRLQQWEDEPEAQLTEVARAINERAGREVTGGWVALVDENGTLGLLRGGIFCSLLSLAPSV